MSRSPDIPDPATAVPSSSRSALRFVLVIGVISFFADFTYEGARSVLGQYLGALGAGAATISIVTGFGALLGYALRLVSGREADRTGRFWPITIFGYFLQLLAVPALALVGNWQAAAALVFAERSGKATRNPPRDAMLSHAAKQMGGFGWAFGVHEAFDQAGAMVGPLAIAAVLAFHHSYRFALAALIMPAVISLTLVLIARAIYPHPENLEATHHAAHTEVPRHLPRKFWLYMVGAGLVAAGFSDYPLLAFHFQRLHRLPAGWIPVLYAFAMGVSGAGSLLFGRLFDRYGFRIIIALTVFSALFAPLVFLGGVPAIIAGVCLWGLGMGVHESVIPAAVAPMVRSDRRASAYGIFTAAYGIASFLGSVAIGLLYDHSLVAAAAFCVVAELAAIPFFLQVLRLE
jgi:predicted MFS family arabinose efflux permease